MVWLMRQDPRWLVDVLVQRKFLPPGRIIEQLPTEIWPVGEENRVRELRADLVMRLWASPPPEKRSLKLIHSCDVIGLLVDFQNRQDLDKELRLPEYGWAYPPVLGQNICLVVITFDEAVARWVSEMLNRRRPDMHHCVLTPRTIPRSGLHDPHLEPERALLEAMLRVRSRRSLPLLTNALRALDNFSGHELLIYQEMLLSQMERTLIMEAHEQLEVEHADPQWRDYQLTKTERQCYYYVRGQEDGAERGREEGVEEGRARAVIDLLQDRGLAPDPATETRILDCRDATQLRAWLVRAAAISRLDELFE
jgi:hypothetical protein